MANFRRRNIILQREIRNVVNDQIVQCQRNDITHVEELLADYRAASSVIFRTICLVIGITCFSTCIYQFYDRLAYYSSTPVRTDVETNDKPFIMPPFSIGGVDTAALRRYWYLLEDKEDINRQFRGFLPEIAFNLPHNVSINYTEFWLATNVTPNFERIYVLGTNNILTDVHLDSGRIIEITNSAVIAWSELNKISGLVTLFKMNGKINLKTEVIIQLRYTAYHPYSMINFAVDAILPFHDAISTGFGNAMSLTYSIKKYEFLNTRQSPCESKEEVGECFRKCLTKLFKNYNCWLPFMPNDVNTVDCSELKNSAVARTVFYSSLRMLHSISPKINCSCQRPCTETKLYLKMDRNYTGVSSRLTVVYKSREATKMEITEILAYDAISLLVDIGGTMGLFLGLSVVSIFTLVQSGTIYVREVIKQPSNKILRKYKYNERVKIELSRLLRQRITYKQSRKSFKYLNIFVNTMLTIFSSLLMYSQIEYFFSYPTKIVIKLEEDDLIHLPNVIACGQGEEIARIKNYVARKEKIDECQLHIVDLIDPYRRLKLGRMNEPTIKLLWAAQSVSCEVRTNRKGKADLVDTYLGNCIEIEFEPIPFVGSSGFIRLEYETFGSTNCNQNLFQLFFRAPEELNYHSLIFNQLDLMSGLLSSAYIETRKVERHNSAVRPCVKYQKFDECRLNCYGFKMQQLIKCSLPFITNINESFCNTSATAKESYYTYLTIVLRTNVQRECNCIRPCSFTVYKINWGNYVIRRNPLHSYINIATLTNLIEYVTEISMLSFTGLWCAFGNILGITLGLSVLSTFHGMFVYFNNIIRNRILNEK